MKRSWSIFYLFIVLAGCSPKDKPSKSDVLISLNGIWEFKSEDGAEWMPATVPGCVHTDLMSNGVIQDPYYRSNEDSVQWVADKIWEYKKEFSVDSGFYKCSRIELIFEGVDTHAEVVLNGVVLSAKTMSGFTDNMFRRWSFDIKSNLREGMNEVVVRFYPATEYNREKAAKLKYQLPEEYVFSRKASYQFGWDWGPKLITCGLWKPVYLQGWSDFKIENLQVIQNSLSDTTSDISLILEVDSDRDDLVDFECLVDGKRRFLEKRIALKTGKNRIRGNISIHNPELWYPNGLGDQKLYTIETRITNGSHFASVEDKTGLRTVELVRQQDSIGESFEFHVNGKPVFMKGANYIPQDNFLARVIPGRFEKLLTMAKDANMNMLRVWGGGIYEDDYFYQLCDSMGLLVWQDFMFACALYPGDSAFLSTVRKEAEEQVIRLRNHPCIALWCGNNEVKNGWEDWGWQDRYTVRQGTVIWDNNRTIFEDIFPSVIERLDPLRPYHASSPEWGWGHPECLTEGDSHYWGVWWGGEPFEVWEAKTGRFMSEYGFQSFPTYATIESFTLPEDRFLNAPVLKAHQKHGRGYQLIDVYMERDYPLPTQLLDYAYVSHLVQAGGIGQALEIHRRRKPHCMGTLYWQLNDCWPVASWSSIDSDYRPKALQYVTRDCFKPVMLTTTDNDTELSLHIVSDLQHDISGKASVVWMDFTGIILDAKEFQISVPENSSSIFYTFPAGNFKEKQRSSLLIIRFEDSDGIIAEKLHYFVRPKELLLPETEITMTFREEENIYRIELVADALVKNLYLYTDSLSSMEFSDNYFDLLPGERKTIICIPDRKMDKESFENSLKSISLKEIR